MISRRFAEGTAYSGAGLLIGTVVWHLTAYASVTTMATDASSALRPITATLWVHVALALLLSAALVLVVARVGASNRTVVLGIAALNPLAGAALQLFYVGFIPPTALLLADGLVILIGAVLGHERQPLSAASRSRQ